jgi:DNA invertase Pin-like site-specific DNA recombinase
VIRGYARASTGSQSLAAQTKRLRASGAAKVYRELASGEHSRVQLHRLLDDIATGDVVLVTRLDHLAQAPEDFAIIVAAIVETGARFHSLRWAERHRGHG